MDCRERLPVPPHLSSLPVLVLTPPYRRIHGDNKPEQKDMFSYILAQPTAARISHEELTAHASNLIIAGTESTSSFSAGCLFHLLSNPRTHKLLVDEIRNAIPPGAEVVDSLLAPLPYLDAVIKEGLRVYPPSPIALPRYSPGETVDGHFIPKGVGIPRNVEGDEG